MFVRTSGCISAQQQCSSCSRRFVHVGDCWSADWRVSVWEVTCSWNSASWTANRSSSAWVLLACWPHLARSPMCGGGNKQEAISSPFDILRNFAKEPGTRISPITLRRGFGQVEDFRRFGQRQPGKKTQLHQFSLYGIMCSQGVQGFI